MSELKVKFLMGPPECNDKNIPFYSKDFINTLSEKLGEKIVYSEIDEVAKEALPVYFIASGGAENGFQAIYEKTSEPYILLTTPAYNSLAASMEIMGFLQERGLKGEILHGSFDDIAERIKNLKKIAEAKKRLSSMKLACFGEPGGLIASYSDFDTLKEKCGAELIMFGLDELVSEFNKGGYPENKYTSELKNKAFDKDEVEKALNVYGALKRLIDKYGLDGVTVKCFDLLNMIHTTGCLALAILNAEGIPAACEGDQKSLISMAVMQALICDAGFMANPSCMDTKANEIIFAHCTLPINMPDKYDLVTHFESGISVAITSDIAPQTMTIFKCDETMSRYCAERAELVETMHRTDLCRTQMCLKLNDGLDYFLTRPISNHHIIVKGDWKNLIEEFFNSI